MIHYFPITSFNDREVIDSAREWIKGKNVKCIKCVPMHINFELLLFDTRLPVELYDHPSLSSDEKEAVNQLKDEIEKTRLSFQSKNIDFEKFLSLKCRMIDILGKQKYRDICKSQHQYDELAEIMDNIARLNNRLNKRLKYRCSICNSQMAKIGCDECHVMYCGTACRRSDKFRHKSICLKYK